MESYERRKKAMSKLNAEEEQDRLSSLPDNVIITIISFLSIKSATITSVLSQRWRNFWTYTTNLSVDQISFTTLDHIISQLESLKIHTVHLQHILTSTIRPSPYDVLLPCIRHICRRNPEVFTLNLRSYSDLDRRLPKYLIPYCLFQTRSLVELVLPDNIHFNFVNQHRLLSSSFKLPNLKKLRLCLYDSNSGLVSKSWALLTACPLLEDLSLTLWYVKEDVIVPHVIDIITPLLKRLRIEVNNGNTPQITQCHKFVIHAPVLEDCHIGGDLMFYEFVRLPSHLQRVTNTFEEDCFRDGDHVTKLPGLIHGISCVRFLTLEHSALYLLNAISEIDTSRLPLFRNLIHLSFSHHLLTWAERLVTGLPPSFLFTNLQRIDVRDLWCVDTEFELIQHILRKATTLKQLHISVILNKENNNGVGNDQLRKEYEFCKKIFMFYKTTVNGEIESSSVVNLNCQIEFSGVAIMASSKDFRDGAFTCQIRNH